MPSETTERADGTCDAPLATAAERLRDARRRYRQAYEEHEHASGHEKAETFAPVGYWEAEVAAALAAWRALAGPDVDEPD